MGFTGLGADNTLSGHMENCMPADQGLRYGNGWRCVPHGRGSARLPRLGNKVENALPARTRVWREGRATGIQAKVENIPAPDLGQWRAFPFDSAPLVRSSSASGRRLGTGQGGVVDFIATFATLMPRDNRGGKGAQTVGFTGGGSG